MEPRPSETVSHSCRRSTPSASPTTTASTRLVALEADDSPSDASASTPCGGSPTATTRPRSSPAAAARSPRAPSPARRARCPAPPAGSRPRRWRRRPPLGVNLQGPSAVRATTRAQRRSRRPPGRRRRRASRPACPLSGRCGSLSSRAAPMPITTTSQCTWRAGTSGDSERVNLLVDRTGEGELPSGAVARRPSPLAPASGRYAHRRFRRPSPGSGGSRRPGTSSRRLSDGARPGGER